MSGHDFCITQQGHNPGITAAIKAIPGARYDPKLRHWLVNVTSPAQVRMILPLLESSETVGEDVLHLCEQILEEDTKPFTVRAGLATNKTLKKYQMEAVKFVSQHNKVIIGDDMGLGKTVEAMAAIDHLGAYPCLVVCPAIVTGNWVREIHEWLPNRSASYDPDAGADFIVVSYDWLSRADTFYFRDGGTGKTFPRVDELKPRVVSLILDESHYIKNPKANRTKACLKLKDTPVVILLSGTVIVNRPAELVPQLRMVSQLDSGFGGWKHFVNRYCAAKATPWGLQYKGAKNLDELNERLRTTCYLRRFKADVLPELPPKTRVRIDVPLPDHVMREYRYVDDQFLNWCRTLGPVKVRSGLMAEALVKMTELRHLAAKGKLDTAVDTVEAFLEDYDDKVVVFAHHRDVIDELARRLQCEKIDGDTSKTRRSEIVHEFQTNDEPRSIVCSMKAAGVGITLTRATTVVFVESGWTPADNDQAEDRLHRIGQLGNVTCVYLIAPGTVDEYIWDLVGEKRSVVTAASDGTPGSHILADYVERNLT